jgi:hypothetical protein
VSYTKASLADLEAVQQDATRTGTAATDAGLRAADDAGHMQAGIERIGEALLTHFHAIADAMRQEAATAGAQLGTADWEGRSRELAVAAESSLQTALTTTLQDAEAGTERFRSTTTAEAGAFVEGIRGEFSAVLQRIDDSFQQLAGAEATFAANLQQADDAVRFEG